MKGPLPAVKEVLDTHWDASQTVLADPPPFIMAQYERAKDAPSVCIKSKNEGPKGSTANTISGKQILLGVVKVDIVGGTWEDVEGKGGNQWTYNNKPNPGIVRESLMEHAATICKDNDHESLRFLYPRDATTWKQSSDDDEVMTLWGTELEIEYERVR